MAELDPLRRGAGRPTVARRQVTSRSRRGDGCGREARLRRAGLWGGAGITEASNSMEASGDARHGGEQRRVWCVSVCEAKPHTVRVNQCSLSSALDLALNNYFFNF